MRSLFLAFCAALTLAGCAAESVWAPDEAVTRAAYRHDGPPRLTLFTMINNSTGGGAHTALMINGSQRVIFDPAGSFNKLGSLPERNDLLYGITPAVEDVYTRYHARETFRVRIQPRLHAAEARLDPPADGLARRPEHRVRVGLERREYVLVAKEGAAAKPKPERHEDHDPRVHARPAAVRHVMPGT